MAQASAEKLEQTGPAEKERVASVPQRKQLARTLSRSCQKEKKQSRLSRVPDHEGGERRRSEREHEEERVDSTVNKGRFQGGKGGQARRAFLREVGESKSG